MSAEELIVDLFAGGGGASEGIRIALNRSPDIAINHDEDALSMHQANHPETRHLRANLMQVSPMRVIGDAPIGLLWASPDCTHHSKAKGGKPVKRHRRDLPWVVMRWIKKKRPRVFVVENVEELAKWGPLVRKLGPDRKPILDVHGSPLLVPCKKREGEDFGRWIEAGRRDGYRIEWRELRACKFGARTTRKRLFVIGRRDGKSIVWPEPTHDDPKSPAVISGGLKPWGTAADCIDWSLPCPSIFLSPEEARALGVRRPLADATMARIAKGVWRYVINAAEPFIVPITHGTDPERGQAVSEPLRTVTTAHRGEHALVTPFLVPRYGERPGQDPRTHAADEPMPTIVTTANQGSLAAVHLAKFQENGCGAPADDPLHTVMAGAPRHAMVAAFLAQHNYQEPGHSPLEPVSTIVTKGCTQALCATHLVNLKGSDRRDAPVSAPLPTVTAAGWHLAEVRAFLLKYYGTDQDPDLREPIDTVTTRDRFGLVLVRGALYQIVDIGMRMLTPRELYRAHSFRDDYIIDRGHDGRRFSKTVQVRMVGNSVPPPFATALVRANVPELAREPAPMLHAAKAYAWGSR
ncbi:MAG TPA: DNA cytosine methyltransferase [Xanthobacteraceae bacterium]|jgi:DNA (cytosine-5)-methyltransferase 1|nr:DNA cytosine methyltransferase [Xanthobacteraceae bacterium]